MSISIQTNVTSLMAQENLSVNQLFESRTIQRLTSGFRINSSGDDAAGLAVANQYRADIAELTQGVQNANNGLTQLQIVDGGLNNISQMLDRMKTLAAESASGTFTGDRGTLNTEYQKLITEITRQASNINLNAGGSFNTNLNVYIGGGRTSNLAGSTQVTVDLSGSSNAVDAVSLALNSTSVIGGGTDFAPNSVANLNNPNVVFNQAAVSGSTSFAIDYADASGNVQSKTVTVTASVGGESGSQFVTDLNAAITSAGISGIAAQIGTNGKLQLTGGSLLQATESDTGLTGGTRVVTNAATLLNGGNYQSAAGTLVALSGGDTQAITVTAGGTNYVTNLTAANGDTAAHAVTALNTALAGSGVYAVQTPAGTVALEGASSFSVATGAATGAGSLFQAGAGAVAVTAPTSSATSTGNALNAITAIDSAVGALGLVQGKVGTGENTLQYAIQLAQSQISSFSGAQSSIRDADVAAEAANLSKAQVLAQSSVAALVQANAMPQAVLALLKG
ncbi:MAG TPA: flagellin [Bryobacteraceae bacterium]|nr:flagellin [Bryobacteraceae bacterium]